ncbi:unnamed protein product [Bursaphelenchus xylophilus]|uniref:(pine wood nematode) hypothetical protein n=1 Tax=Bursaphelenchus xylophilus TaxID=6326 RepID=A0A1I7SA96_BURXY|nr:unnamed protein product [Bursaphelenchus xylophilus]CAG9084161.1 unnamed protein product [Bursaphelenchus xylophilus]
MKAPLYTEESQIGLHLNEYAPSFDDNTRHCAFISRTSVIVLDVKTGSRRNIFQHHTAIVGIEWNGDHLLSISQKGEVFKWNVGENKLVETRKMKIDGRLVYIYVVKGTLFGLLNNKSGDILLKIDLQKFECKTIAVLPCRIERPKQLAVGSDFLVYCSGRRVNVIGFDDSFTPQETEFFFGQHFTSAEYNKEIEFSSIKVVEDNVFAVLNIGRVYSWNRVDKYGLTASNRTFFHSHNSEVNIAVTSLLAVFCGTGNCRVDKWNMTTSGKGKYEQFHAMERMDSAVDSLWLSRDDSVLVAVLADNSLVVLNTSTLAVISRPQTIQWSPEPPTDWIGLKTDVEHPNYIVTNSRHGYVQWIDPVKWRTIAEFDVAKENPPTRDSITAPQYDWTNVYQIALSSSLIVTCQLLRHNAEKTILKFFTRLPTRSINDIKYLNSIELFWKVKFLRLSQEEEKHHAKDEGEYAIAVDYNGKILSFQHDPTRRRKFCLDLKKQASWNNTLIFGCSSVRENLFATVNGIEEKDTFVILWNGNYLNTVECLDQIPGVKSVAWAPLTQNPNFLLMSGDIGVLAFDITNRTFTWAIQQTGLNLYCDRLVSFGYNKEDVFWFDSSTGDLIKKLSFSSPQEQIVATGSESNIRFTALNSQGLSLLKSEIEENQSLREVTLDFKKTPFSALAQLVRSQRVEQYPNRRINTSKTLSARKLLEGTAYTLAPLTKLGPTFVESCLLLKSSN